MREYDSPYIVSRRGRSARPRSGRGGRGGGRRNNAGLLIGALIFLTAAICLLVVLLPKFTSGAKTVGGAPVFGGKTYYALCVGETTDYQTATVFVQDTANRGGAGLLYNNGSYTAIAAIYEREADAKALAEINENARCVPVPLPKVECGDGDKKALEYLCGEFFSAVDGAATELDRGNIDEATADYAVKRAFAALSLLGNGAETQAIRAAIERACDYDIADIGGRSVLSYIRFTVSRVVVAVAESLT